MQSVFGMFRDAYSKGDADTYLNSKNIVCCPTEFRILSYIAVQV